MNVFRTIKAIQRSTELSDKAKAVGTRLALYLNDGIADPTVAQLANETGRDKRSVQRALAELQAKGWLLRTFPKGQNASKTPTIYRLTAKATGEEVRGVKSVTPRGVKSVTQEESTKEGPKESADAPPPFSKSEGKGGQVFEFPSQGHPRHEPWVMEDLLASGLLSGPQRYWPCLTQIADAFRATRRKQGKGLTGRDVRAHFRNWLRRAA